jgi:hypothetical protein
VNRRSKGCRNRRMLPEPTGEPRGAPPATLVGGLERVRIVVRLRHRMRERT